MPDYSTVLQESRSKRRSVVLERVSGFSESGSYRVTTATRFYREEDAMAFYAAEMARRIKKSGDFREQT